MVPKIERIIDAVLLGEGLHWDAETQSLYFVDVDGHFIHKYVPATKAHTKAYIGKTVSIVIPVKGKDDRFVAAIERQIALIEWDGQSKNTSVLQTLYQIEENTISEFNDGKCDPSGRLWAGTMGPMPNVEDIDNIKISDEQGNLFSFEGKTVTTRLSKIGMSNGLAFNTDLKKFYYVDSFKGTLDEYDFDIVTGEISNGKVIYTLNETRGIGSKKVLDGMTIDTEGNLWVAVFNDSKVIKIDPRKPETVADTIEMPAKQVTSVTFGGPNLDELYVTTARLPMFGETPSSPDDGAIFRVTGLNAKGLPGVRVVL